MLFIFSVPFEAKYSLPFLICLTLCFLKDGGLENLSSVADAQTLMSLYFALCTKVSGTALQPLVRLSEFY